MRHRDWGKAKHLGKLRVLAWLVGQCHSSKCLSRAEKHVLRVGSREKRNDFPFSACWVWDTYGTSRLRCPVAVEYVGLEFRRKISELNWIYSSRVDCSVMVRTFGLRRGDWSLSPWILTEWGQPGEDEENQERVLTLKFRKVICRKEDIVSFSTERSRR